MSINESESELDSELKLTGKMFTDIYVYRIFLHYFDS